LIIQHVSTRDTVQWAGMRNLVDSRIHVCSVQTTDVPDSNF